MARKPASHRAGGGGLWPLTVQRQTVQVRPHPQFGRILVGPTGLTLYTFARDQAGASNCYDTCEQNWPPLRVARIGRRGARTATASTTSGSSPSREGRGTGRPLAAPGPARRGSGAAAASASSLLTWHTARRHVGHTCVGTSTEGCLAHQDPRPSAARRSPSPGVRRPTSKACPTPHRR
ncbi:COG4315 family predicted lipoprotein [Geochorda subterranea]|uniref:hypothetical protein n=1 Tax=Geochorda subterranea TaxID=3109564 RepID=UPI00386024ED